MHGIRTNARLLTQPGGGLDVSKRGDYAFKPAKNCVKCESPALSRAAGLSDHRIGAISTMAGVIISLDATPEQVRAAFDLDPIAGVLTWRYRPEGPTSWNTRLAGKIAGSVDPSTGYHRTHLFRRFYLTHRLIWMHFYGASAPTFIDHQDTNILNNAVSNLRAATKNQNIANQKSSVGRNMTGYKGVVWKPRIQRWIAQITVNGQKRHLGTFTDPATAHEAYRAAATEAFGEFARFE